MPISRMKLKNGELMVNGVELSEYLSISAMQVSRLRQEGTFVQDGGRYHLKRSVQSYIARLKTKQNGMAVDREQTEAEKIFWAKENEKTKNLAWRAQYGQEIIERLLASMGAYFDQCREAVGKYPEACAVLREMSSKCKKVDIDSIVLGQAEQREESQDGE